MQAIRISALRSGFRSSLCTCGLASSFFSHRKNSALTLDRRSQHEHDQRIHHGVVEIVVGKADLVAEPVRDMIELGADHADERIGHRELDAGEDVRRRSRAA